MIKSMKITPLYEEWKNLGIVQATGFGIYVECGFNDADKIFNLVKEMTNHRDPTESEEVHPSDTTS